MLASGGRKAGSGKQVCLGALHFFVTVRGWLVSICRVGGLFRVGLALLGSGVCLGSSVKCASGLPRFSAACLGRFGPWLKCHYF